jgi:hypothetical protein
LLHNCTPRDIEMNSLVLSIYNLLIHLTNDISHLIKLSFNTLKSTRGLDALSNGEGQVDIQSEESSYP